jgi:hypothetical protein
MTFADGFPSESKPGPGPFDNVIPDALSSTPYRFWFRLCRIGKAAIQTLAVCGLIRESHLSHGQFQN